MLHRNDHQLTQYTFKLEPRLKLVALGMIILLVGLVRQLSGEVVLTHWTGQPQYSFGLIAAGGFMIVMAFIPSSWLSKLFVRPKPTFPNVGNHPGSRKL